MSNSKIPATIAPLIRRHAEDAAFYWLQHDASAYSPRLNLAGLERFSQLLTAHLEGLHVAGDAGWQPSLAALQKWKQPGEAFVCAHTALQNNDPAQLQALMQEVSARPDELLRGIISALAWVPRERALANVAAWSAADSGPVKQVSALRGAALLGLGATASLSQPIDYFLGSANPHVRSAACRAAGQTLGPSTPDALLRQALQDPEITVRAEAAITLGQHAYAQGQHNTPAAIQVADTLWHAIVAQVELHNTATGWYRKQALRRLNRWVQYLACLVPTGNTELAALLAFMPPRVALRFVAYHGDPAHLPFVLTHMGHPDTARYAGWVWQSITGVDLQAAGMTLPEPELEEGAPAVTQMQLDADAGMPLPNAQAIGRHSTVALHTGTRYLLGQPMSPPQLLDVVQDAPQALRSIASMHLQLAHPQAKLGLRGPAQMQQQALGAMRASTT
jgi:uncharacterized protein (TIGR02270 family)